MSSYTTDETGTAITAFPLQWPLQYPRTSRPVASAFKTTLGEARDGLLAELKHLGATTVIISSNLPLKRDGTPYARQAGIQDAGVAVYFTYLDGPRALACDKWLVLADNFQALRKTVEAMRALPRWGCSDIMRGTFTGLLALPPARSGAPAAGEWWPLVLNLPATATEAAIRQASRELLGGIGRDATLSEEERQHQQERIILARGKALGALSK